MCGIAGFINLDNQPASTTLINSMTRMISHRGPDSHEVHVDGPLALGFRRLAILDLSPAGNQPLSYADRRYWIVFNGEIYNFLELRNELKGLGYSFRTETDTEVILAAYIQWGSSCQLKFNGMWAFAIWDGVEKKLFLSRDRFGVKPLHFFYNGQVFGFASEMKAFLPAPWITGSFNIPVMARALVDYNQIEGTTDCILQGINRLRGGYCLHIPLGGAPKVERWWRTLDHLTAVGPTLEHQAAEFRDIFVDAVNVRMRSDVPIGTALSGGLDSSSVLCSMAWLKSHLASSERQPDDWQRAFVAYFPGTVQDELHHARAAIAHSNAKEVILEMTPDKCLHNLHKILFDFEEVYDFIGPIWSTYNAMREKGVVVSLDGHGGDELLAGYHFYFPTALRDAEMLPMPNQRLREIYEIHMQWQQTGEYPEDHVPVDQSGWITAPVAPADWSDFEKDQFVLSGFDALSRQLYFDFHHRCLPTILRNFDRCSMSNGVEIRAPFMDWRLVTYCFSLPSYSKLGRGFTKLVLREALRGILPPSIANRKSKLGFVSPMSKWTEGPLRTFLLDTVRSREFLQSNLINGPKISAYVEHSYANGGLKAIVSVWRFIQAHLIQQVFQAERMKYMGATGEERASSGL